MNLQNVGVGSAPSRFYGVLCEPKAPGKYPALLSVPEAGVRPYRGMATIAARGVSPIGAQLVPCTIRGGAKPQPGRASESKAAAKAVRTATKLSYGVTERYGAGY